LRIEDYALIGDCESAALVGRNGSIDWLCWPRFDSEALFSALVGEAEHGYWRISPAQGRPVARRYRPGTLVLETEFEAEGGARLRVTDFMPVRSGDPTLVRRLEAIGGAVAVHSELLPRFDYGRITPWIHSVAEGVRALAGPHSVLLRSPVDPKIRDGKIAAAFEVSPERPCDLVLTYEPSHVYTPDTVDPERALKETVRFWGGWTGKSRYRGRAAEVVNRSLITIKALTYAPTGGIVAAPTTSLPEEIGGERNWDYRFCWLRDATFSVKSLINAGYREEAEAWCDWLLRAIAGDPDKVQPLYGLAGEQRLEERTLDWLPGFEGSRPVRTGNGAYSQLQIDVFGSVMDALHHGAVNGLEVREARETLERSLMERLEAVWRCKDEGIWEVRSEPRHFLHSKVMAWTAFDRAIRSAEAFDYKGPVERWRALRTEIHAEVCERGFNASVGAFTQAYDTEHLDAAALLIPLVGFLPADDPRMVSTVAAIEARLCPQGLVLRYDPDASQDGIGGGEGAFLACSFWLVENLKLQGREREAVEWFDRLVGLANDVGLLAEEYDPKHRRQLGNFPQAFSHFALVDSAFTLSGDAPGPDSSSSPRTRGSPEA